MSDSGPFPGHIPTKVILSWSSTAEQSNCPQNKGNVLQNVTDPPFLPFSSSNVLLLYNDKQKMRDSLQLLCLSSPCWEGFPVLRCSLSRRPTYSSTAYFLLSGSFSLIFSSTLISSRAASLYFSTFLMIFRATRAPPLQDGRKGFCWNLKNISE